MTTIATVSAALAKNLSLLEEDLTQMATDVEAAKLQYKLLNESKQEASIGTNVGGLDVIGSAGKRFNEDGTVSTTGIATFSDKLDTFGSLTSQTGGALLTKTVTGATAQSASAAFENTFQSALTKRKLFEASLVASEALADESILPTGASTASLLTDAADTLIERSNNMLDKANFKSSILEDIVDIANLSDNITVSELLTENVGSPSIPVIDFKSVPQRTILQTYEEMEAYIRSCAREITEVVVHATDTTRDMNVDYDVLFQWDVFKRGFTDVGYHFIIKRDGALQVCRPISRKGAHTFNNHNQYSIGIAFAGGKLGNRKQKSSKRSDRSFTDEQFNTFDAFMQAFYTVIPGGQAWGHNDIDVTRRSDPHFNVPEYVRKKFNKINVQTAQETRQTGAIPIDELIRIQYARVS